MSVDSSELVAAKIEAERARARLIETARELQTRLNPRTLAQNAWEGAKDKGADLAEGAVDAVRARPLAATGVVAALALFLAREPVKDLATRFVGGARESRGKDAAAKKKKPSRKPRSEKVE